ncbi:MAG TPA: energy transducer TonB [Flavobacteriaceae bacterium]|nr:energy transducer TonB [Flavobacteriaceae bacterium]
MKQIHQLLAFFNGSKKSRQPSKKEVQLQYNSTSFFLLGIILVSIGVWVLAETNFKVDQLAYVDPTKPQLPEENFNFTINLIDTEVKQEPHKQEEVKKIEKKVIQHVKPIEDDQSLEPTDTEIIPDDNKAIPTNTTLTNPEPYVEPKIDDHTPQYLHTVELVPVFPGCGNLKDNASRIQCMSEEIHKIINRRFNHSIIDRLGVEKEVKIYVNFVVDQSGYVTQIQARSPYPQLDLEAQRVLGYIPQLEPALQNDKPVNVVYNLPIVIQVY